MKELDLAALMVSRVCHDLIGPVAAVSNGVEVLADDDDPEMRGHAMALISRSAAQAAAKLLFARLAFGASGSLGALVEVNEAKTVLENLLKDTKVRLVWTAADGYYPKDVVKLVANLAFMGSDTITRGGTLTVSMTREGERLDIAVVGEGPLAKLDPAYAPVLAGETALDSIDGRSVQAFMTGLIARSLGGNAAASVEGNKVTLAATVTLPKAA